MLKDLQQGDVVVVTRLDRLARSVRDLLNILERFGQDDVGFVSLREKHIDTTSAGGRLVLNIMASIAEFERELIQARMAEGRKRAINNGVKFGRPHKLDAFQRREALKRLEAGESQSLIARTFNVDRATMQKLADLDDILHLPELPTTKYLLVRAVAKKVATLAKWELAGKIIEGLEEFDLVVLVPFDLWKDFIEAQQEGVEKAEAIGAVTAVRSWLNDLILLTFSKESDFPDDVKIDLTVPITAGESYYLGRYFAEANATDAARGEPPQKRFVLFDEDLKRGFDHGAETMEKVWPEILRTAKQVMSDVLRDMKLDSCKMQVLTDADFLNLAKLKASIVRELARRLLDELPEV
jgi:Resolvase, N terminal domain